MENINENEHNKQKNWARAISSAIDVLECAKLGETKAAGSGKANVKKADEHEQE